jgi:threonine dehydrogenase-like Zn-dependent dehydrogenase
MAGSKIDLDPLITADCALHDWQKAFALLQNLEAIKILLKP